MEAVRESDVKRVAKQCAYGLADMFLDIGFAGVLDCSGNCIAGSRLGGLLSCMR